MRGSEISCQRFKSEGTNARVCAPAQIATKPADRNQRVLSVFLRDSASPRQVSPSRYNITSMPFQEVVEAEGHLIDSHIMENIFDKVVEHNGRFEVEQFRIGRTNSEPSYL